MVNKKEISEKLKAEGRTIASWARIHGHKVSTVHMALDGRLNPTAYASRAILADLKKGGYIAEEEDEPAAA